MSDYQDKYLKYKKKYIDLKNNHELDGGWWPFGKSTPSKPKETHVIYFYDNTNPIVGEFFDEIKEGYEDRHRRNQQNTSVYTPHIMTNRPDFCKKLNGIFNIFKYELGTDIVRPQFCLNFTDLCLDMNYSNCKTKPTSNRMIPLVKPFTKAINEYIKQATLKFTTATRTEHLKMPNTVISCDNLEVEATKILKFINGHINTTLIIKPVMNLLQLVKLYQDFAIGPIIKYQTKRIGAYSTLSDKIVNPSGTQSSTLITKIVNNDPTNTDSSIESDEIKLGLTTGTINKLKDYTANTTDELSDIGLEIKKLEFNEVNDMIYFKIIGDQVEVFNIFRKPQTATTGQPDETTNED